MPERFIHLRHRDGREQRVVKGAAGERVATRMEGEGWKRYEPAQPYTAEDAARAARVAAKRDQSPKPRKTSEGPSEATTEAAEGTS